MISGCICASRRYLSVPLVALILGAAPVYADRLETGTFYLHTDHLGSVTAVSDPAGNVVARNAYGPNGAPHTVTAPGEQASRARFAGKLWEPESGLYYFGARYQDPALGRFLGPDAARQDSSPYGYVGAAPLQRVDPDGNRYPEFRQILDQVASEYHIALDDPEERLRAAYLARVEAIEIRRSLEKQVAPHADRIRRIEHAIRKARHEAKRDRLKPGGPYLRLAEAARATKRFADNLGPDPSFRMSRHFKLEVADAQTKYGRVAAEWKQVRDDLAKWEDMSREDVVGSRWGAQRTILDTAAEKFSNVKYRQIEFKEKFDALYRKSRRIHARHRRALARADRINRVVMPELDAYINTQRRSLGLPPDKPWSVMRAELESP